MTDSIQITMICFAGLKEKVGSGRISLTIPVNSTCTEFISQLVASYPQTQVYSSCLLVARNGNYLNETDIIQDQDELACFPPVSGG
ncbi:MAG: MoaD/ThiS family protein [Planctomycetaceae bacterium]|nr:MoaD/ThiS family protein [Planctomycetaceae bacterium]